MSYDIDDAISELRELLLDTPKKPMLPDEKLVQNYEEKIGFKFSDNYKKFLMKASDVFVGTLSPFVITKDGNAQGELALAVAAARAAGVPHSWLPVCEDNGDYYCILSDGKVRFWSHDGVSEDSWENLESWIKQVWIGQG
ncbi:MAG: SMI1/KNR4 family protein [Wenzhouxiangellaceae bacterium]